MPLGLTQKFERTVSFSRGARRALSRRYLQHLMSISVHTDIQTATADNNHIPCRGEPRVDGFCAARQEPGAEVASRCSARAALQPLRLTGLSAGHTGCEMTLLECGRFGMQYTCSPTALDSERAEIIVHYRCGAWSTHVSDDK